MNTLLIWASIGACGVGAVLGVIAVGWLLDRWASRPVEIGGVHRALKELAPAPVVAFRPLPMEAATATIAERYAALQAEERTEEMPVDETPVEHHGADADWSPTAELALIPERPVDAIAAMEAEIEEEVRRDIAAIFDPIEAALARIGHLEQDTCEISFEHLRLAVDAARAGAL